MVISHDLEVYITKGSGVLTCGSVEEGKYGLKPHENGRAKEIGYVPYEVLNYVDLAEDE